MCMMGRNPNRVIREGAVSMRVSHHFVPQKRSKSIDNRVQIAYI